MSLRLQINVIIAALAALFVAMLVWERIDDSRRSVREEIDAAHLVATQVLRQVSIAYARGGLGGMRVFLNQLGRVRANDITLFDADGALLYRSPPFVYKAGRYAPAWFARIVEPPTEPVEIQLEGGRMVLRADPSRSSLDGWDELVQLLQVAAVGLTVVIALVYALAGVALRPFTRLVDGLRRVGHGDFDIRLALPRGVEARAVTEAFNRMVQSVRDSVAATAAAAEARARLDDNLALTRIIQQRIEEERRSIARELHDELGQQITAIKSMGLAIAQRSAPLDPSVAQTARLVVDTATRMYDGVHRMIVQLRPLALDDSALGDALEEMIAEWRARRPQIAFGLQLDAVPDELPEAVSTTAYRVVQEALTNAVRHADGASSVAVNLRGDGERLEIRVADNGPGLADDWDRRGRLGLVGLRERVTALGGTFDVLAAAQRGAEIAVCLPVRPLPASTANPGES